MVNAFNTFQWYINWVLYQYLNNFCSAYLNDVLIFTNGTQFEHCEYVNKMLNCLDETELFLDIKKCEFEVIKIKYLKFIVNARVSIQMDSEKIKAITEWQPFTTVKGVWSFLGFVNFYQQFIKFFAEVAVPLTKLISDVSWWWTEQEQKVFKRLKTAFVSEPILTSFDPDCETILEADLSGYITENIFSQFNNKGVLRSCMYFSKKNSSAECNYEIHDKELLAVIHCLQE